MEIELSGKTYAVGKMDAFSQLHVARKLGPAIPLLEGLVKKENADKNLSLLTLLTMSQISDEASVYVMQKCLSVVSVKQERGWAKLAAPDGSLMFDDLSMEDMLKLTAQVIEENLGNFFRTSLGELNKEAEQQA